VRLTLYYAKVYTTVYYLVLTVLYVYIISTYVGALLKKSVRVSILFLDVADLTRVEWDRWWNPALGIAVLSSASMYACVQGTNIGISSVVLIFHVRFGFWGFFIRCVSIIWITT
jgi:hypothetical protein